MKDSELEKLLEESLEAEKIIVRSICHNVLREEMYGEKLQNVVIFHLENFIKNIFDLALHQNLIEYGECSTPLKRSNQTAKSEE